MYSYIFVLISSFLISFLSIPSIMHLAAKKNLYGRAKPVLNGLSKRQISSLGGIAIFIALRITHSIFIDIPNFPVNYYIAALFILFLVGLNDDLTGVKPLNRLLAQFIVSLIIIFPGELYFNNLDQLLGNLVLNPIVIKLGTALFIVGLINAYNLIDGIDGLAGLLGALGSIIFAYLFFRSGNTQLALFCLSLFGALLGFLVYNISPAKIFMGDSGAYIIGFTFALLSIELINQVQQSPINLAGIQIKSAFGIVAAITIIPVFDGLRVFTLRLLTKAHPFKGDNNHIHHRLLKIGLTHTEIALSLSLTTLAFCILSLSLQHLNPFIQLSILFGLTLLLNIVSHVIYSNKNNLMANQTPKKIHSK